MKTWHLTWRLYCLLGPCNGLLPGLPAFTLTSPPPHPLHPRQSCFLYKNQFDLLKMKIPSHHFLVWSPPVTSRSCHAAPLASLCRSVPQLPASISDVSLYHLSPLIQPPWPASFTAPNICWRWLSCRSCFCYLICSPIDLRVTSFLTPSDPGLTSSKRQSWIV